MDQYRNFVGDPYLNCCSGGYKNATEEPIEGEPKKKRLVGLAMTGLMILGVIVAFGWAYKKIK